MYWGKIIGTLAGLATTKPLLGLLGLILGHQFDRGFAARFQRSRDPGTDGRQLGDEYLRALFQAMGHLAKIDGRVTEDEIRAARSVMHRLGLGPAKVQNAIGWFSSGKDRSFSLDRTVRDLARSGARRPETRALFVRLLLEVSLSKNRMGQEERAAIWSVCRELGISRVEIAQLEAIIRAQKGFRRSPAGSADRARVTAAYAVLGLEPTASNDDIKRAYRRLMNRNHPDKIASSNPGDAMIAEASRKTREVRTAYEFLKARREIR